MVEGFVFPWYSLGSCPTNDYADLSQLKRFILRFYHMLSARIWSIGLLLIVGG